MYAYKEYHRTNENVAAAPASYNLPALELIHEFDQDDSGSLHKYSGKIIRVKGPVKDIERDETNRYTIFLGDSLHSSSLRCSMDSGYTLGLSAVTVGKEISIKGVLVGVDPDATGLLGSDITMNRCIAEK